jgi:hypothetical protein
MRELRFTASFFVLFAGYLSGCQTLRSRQDPLHVAIVTDSQEIAVTLEGISYRASIGFTFTNTTGRVISRSGCGGPGWPDVEKNVGDRWVPAFYQIYLACRTYPDFSWQPGAKFHDRVTFMAFVRGKRNLPELMVDSIDGVYRLHWSFTEGRDPSAKNARRVDAISNSFHMTLRSPPDLSR